MWKQLKPRIAANGEQGHLCLMQVVFVPLLNEHVIHGQRMRFERRIDVLD